MGDLYQDPICTECNNRHSNIDYCPPWSPPAPPAGTGWSRCDRCGAVHPSAPFAHIHKCQCTGGMMKPIPAGGDIRPPNCRNWLAANGKAHPKSGCQVEGCAGALGLCLAVNPEAAVQPAAPPVLREHHHTELIKRAIIRAHVQMTKGLGMSQAARLATDEIITLFVDDHRCMEPYCNCPVGLADDAYDSGGPLSGYPRPLCLIHNPDPKGRR